jgi:Flp pilus assembly protein TadB
MERKLQIEASHERKRQQVQKEADESRRQHLIQGLRRAVKRRQRKTARNMVKRLKPLWAAEVCCTAALLGSLTMGWLSRW